MVIVAIPMALLLFSFVAFFKVRGKYFTAGLASAQWQSGMLGCTDVGGM